MTIPNFRPLCLIVVTFAVVFGVSSWLFDGSRSETLLKRKGVQISHDERGRVVSVSAEGIELSDDDLILAAGFRDLKYVSLQHTTLPRSGLGKLRAAKKLFKLDLSHSTLSGPTADPLLLPTTLRDLNLSKCPWLTDRHLADVSELKGLERLEFSSSAITLAGLIHLSQLPALYEVVTEDCAYIDDAAVEQLAGLAQLKQFTLSGTELTSQGYLQLQQRLPRTKLIHPVNSLKDLREISQRGGFQADASGKIFSFHHNWDRDGVKRPLRPGDLTVIGKLADLRSLDVKGDVTDQMLLELGPLPQLDHLFLHDTLITDDGLRVLEGFPNLSNLRIRGTHFEGPGLRHLAHLTELRLLDIKVQSEDELLEVLPQLTRLERLEVHAPLTDAGLLRLPTLPILTALEIHDARITGPGLAGLARLPNLPNLYYSGTGTLQDEPFIECVSQLKSLRGIELYQSGVTLEVCQRLRKLRPNLFVQWFDSNSKAWIKVE